MGLEGVPVPGLPAGHLRVTWERYTGSVPRSAHNARYAAGSIVLLLLIAGALALNRRELRGARV